MNIYPQSGTSSTNLFDKILYTVEYVVLIGVCMAAYSFLVFWISEMLHVGIMGIYVLLLWIGSFYVFNIILAPLVYRDVKKLQSKGAVIEVGAFGWSLVVFTFPVLGLAMYLAARRADYKKQLATFSSPQPIVPNQ